jgi:regulatory protein
MPKITKIKPQRRKGRFNIFLDDQFTIGVSQEVIVALDLKEGKEVDAKRLKNLEKLEEENKVYEAALRFLSYRFRSEKEVLDKLKTKKFNERIIKKIVQRLKQEKLLDDEEFARAWLRNRKILRPSGKQLIFWELKQKGLKEETIKKILKESYNKDEEMALAKKVALQKKRVYQNLPIKESRQKMLGFLKRRGFDWDVIKGVLDEIYKMV